MKAVLHVIAVGGGKYLFTDVKLIFRLLNAKQVGKAVSCRLIFFLLAFSLLYLPVCLRASERLYGVNMHGSSWIQSVSQSAKLAKHIHDLRLTRAS